MQADVMTPLRYPGGKSILTDYFERFIIENNLEKAIYAEPYCGGAGAAINLLLTNRVDRIILNDADISIYAFWHSIKYLGEDFIEKLEGIDISIEEWFKQKAIFVDGKNGNEKDLFKLGFATFFLNRCNRSGILSAGPIGGNSITSQKDATYKIDARFKKDVLIQKISAIVNARDKIEVFNLDALSFLKNIIRDIPRTQQEQTFVYLDPPYYNQGSSLYLNYYKNDDHVSLRDFLIKEDYFFKWILSYDNVQTIKDIYKGFMIHSFYINYSAQQNKLGSEILIKSHNSILPELAVLKIFQNRKRIELTTLK